MSSCLQKDQEKKKFGLLFKPSAKRLSTDCGQRMRLLPCTIVFLNGLMHRFTFLMKVFPIERVSMSTVVLYLRICPFFVLESITKAVHNGDIEAATSLFSKYYRTLDRWPHALVLYADCIRMQGGCAEPLYIRSITETYLPSPYPSYLPLDFDFIHQGMGESVMKELALFLDDPEF